MSRFEKIDPKVEAALLWVLDALIENVKEKVIEPETVSALSNALSTLLSFYVR